MPIFVIIVLLLELMTTRLKLCYGAGHFINLTILVNDLTRWNAKDSMGFLGGC